MRKLVRSMGFVLALAMAGAGHAKAQSLDLVPDFAALPVPDLAAVALKGPGALQDPASILETGSILLLPLANQTVPILPVLSGNPAGLPGFLLGEGTIITPSLVALPRIPILTVPLR